MLQIKQRYIEMTEDYLIGFRKNIDECKKSRTRIAKILGIEPIKRNNIINLQEYKDARTDK